MEEQTTGIQQTTEEVGEKLEEVNKTNEEMPSQAPEGEVVEKPEQTVGKKGNDNTIYVGKKGTMGYVLAVVTQFNNGASEVTVKARGKLISRAVDVAEIVKHRFIPDAKIDDISIATEELTSEDGSKSKVSSIEIKIKK